MMLIMSSNLAVLFFGVGAALIVIGSRAIRSRHNNEAALRRLENAELLHEQDQIEVRSRMLRNKEFIDRGGLFSGYDGGYSGGHGGHSGGHGGFSGGHDSGGGGGHAGGH